MGCLVIFLELAFIGLILGVTTGNGNWSNLNILVRIIIVLVSVALLYFINKWYKKYKEHKMELIRKQKEVKKEQIISFDIETTGIKKEKNEILQIALIDGNEKVLFYSLIKPQKRKRWSEAEEINGISPKMVATAPILSDIEEQIFNILNNAKVIVGYNLNDFDIPFIEYHIGKYIKTRTIDIMQIFSNEIIKEWSDYFQDYKKQSLSKCCKYYKIENPKEHDSLGDAKATLRCFYKMIDNNSISNVILID